MAAAHQDVGGAVVAGADLLHFSALSADFCKHGASCTDSTALTAPALEGM